VLTEAEGKNKVVLARLRRWLDAQQARKDKAVAKLVLAARAKSSA
jgi:hypothetical protein